MLIAKVFNEVDDSLMTTDNEVFDHMYTWLCLLFFVVKLLFKFSAEIWVSAYFCVKLVNEQNILKLGQH